MKKNVCMTAVLCLVNLLLSASLTWAFAAGSVPVAENMELTTEINTGIESTLSARDSGEGTLSFQITTEPRKGEVTLMEDGRFVYTPNVNRKGRDYFGYRAISSEGGVSEEATVLIRIEKAR